MAKGHLSEKLAVILHADVAGSTALVQQDEHLAHERIQDSFRCFGEIIEQHRGRMLELRGDALLAEFERPSDAVTAALAFQANHHNYLLNLNDDIQPQIRVGIALGEIIVADNTATGAGVVLAQRVEQLADAGGLCITSAIHEALPRRMPFDFENLGEQTLKGFDDQVRVFQVRLSSGSSLPSPQLDIQSINQQNPWGRIAVVALVVLVMLGGLVFSLIDREQQENSGSLAPAALLLPDKPSIAVLPFANMSSDNEQEYFADGMTEDLITDISKISGLDVIARHSTYSYKGQSPDVRKVGQELGASHVIEGSVRKAGNTVRITIQLINASDGKHVWAERYDRELRDVFTIQDEVLAEIVTALSLRLTPDEKRRVIKRGTQNLAAYDLYMRGRQQESFFTKESYVEAQYYYEQAVALDSNFAEAWAHLAQIHTLNGQFGWVDDIVAADSKALKLVEKSIELDPDIPFSRFSYSRILARNSIKQHDRAIEEAKKAIELDPNYADALAYLAQLFVLTGKAEQSIEPIKSAMHVNPNFPFWYHYTYGFAHFFMGDFATAAENIEKAMDRNPNVIFIRAAYAASLAMAGLQDEAEWQIDELHGIGFSKTLDELMRDSNIQGTSYRALYREGLEKAGLS